MSGLAGAIVDRVAARVSALQAVEATDGPTAYTRRLDGRRAGPLDPSRLMDRLRRDPWPGLADHSPTDGVLVCVGDSITMGMYSGNYVALLRRGFPAAHIVNAGINGNLAHTVAGRLNPIVACRPDAVTLLIGTNDVNATFNSTWAKRYRREQRLPRDADLALYVEGVSSAIDGLRERTDARLALLEIPMLGEDLDSPINEVVRTYNAALHEVAADRAVPCLPLYQRLAALIDPSAQPPPYDGSLVPAVRVVARRVLLRRTWDEAGRAEGLALLTDHIHLNDRAAGVIADLVAGFVGDSPRGPDTSQAAP